MRPTEHAREKAGDRLPSGWRVARVGDVLTVRNGYAVKSSDYRESGVPLIRQSDIQGDTIDVSGAKRVSSRVMEECKGYLVREGDLLIGIRGTRSTKSAYWVVAVKARIHSWLRETRPQIR